MDNFDKNNTVIFSDTASMIPVKDKIQLLTLVTSLFSNKFVIIKHFIP